MITMNSRFLFSVLFFTVLLFGCEKKVKSTSDTLIDSDITTATDDNLVNGVFNDVENIADQAFSGTIISFLHQYNDSDQKDVVHEKSSCATITHNQNAVPKFLTIDFGNANCLCNDGKNRRGQIIVTYTGVYNESGSEHTITFNDYYVNDNKVLGSKTVVNNGLNTDDKLTFSVEVDAQLVKANSTDTITWVSSRVRVWEEGNSTLSWLDDVYSISGNSSGITSTGISYTANITSPLIIDLSCHWIESGVIEITPSGKLKRILDYGTSGCDANATVSISGVSFPIVLP
jgi:hypothetical protein